MLPVVFALVAIAVARVRVWRVAEGSQTLTAAMLAFALAGILFLPDVGENLIDPRHWWGANFGTLLQHLATVFGFYLLGILAFHQTKVLPWWRMTTFAVMALLVITYRLGPEYRTPTKEFGLSSATGLIHQSTYLAFSAALCAALILRAYDDKIPGCRRNRLRQAMLVGVAVSGFGWALMTTVMLAVNPDYLRANYHDLCSVWAFPALLSLAGAGVPGFVRAWHYRHDPARRRPFFIPLWRL